MPKSLGLTRLGLAALALATACRSEPLGADGSEGAGAASGASPGAGAEPIVTTVLDAVHITSDPEDSHFQAAVAPVDFGRSQVESARLIVTLVSPCFPFSGWAEQEIPSGQVWPAACDAFDRTLSVSLDPEGDADDAPELELLRAITPFGGPLELQTDLTDIVNGLPGVHQLRFAIDTWSDAEGLVSGSRGEWIASARVELTPGAAPRHVLAVTALANESQLEVDAAPIAFDAPEGASAARIEYRATGHGAVSDLRCRGPAEEFCPRSHELSLDGEGLAALTPWRSDCAALCTLTQNDAELGPAEYCAENPCGAPASVRAPRANWCPGSATDPIVIDLPTLTPGRHELGRRILELHEGGSWRISATYFAFE